ncbi:MAG: DMT family transporter [Acidobacteriaceae bacterium]
MPQWLRYSLLAILAYGVWGAVSSLSSQHVSPLTLQIVSTIGLFPVTLVLAFSRKLGQGANRSRGILLALLTGVIGGTGNLTLYESLRVGGEASIVFPLTGMYPLVTIVLARLLLKESLNRIQALGIALALAAVYLFSAQQSTRGFSGWRDLFSSWMAYALLTLLLFGTSCITQKFATRYISDELCTIFFTIGFVPLAIVIWVAGSPPWNLSVRDWVLGIVVGLLMATGTLALFAAFRRGKASVVAPFVALYPLVTVILAVVFLNEHLDSIKVGAIALALIAGMALSKEGDQPSADLSHNPAQ